MPILKRVGRILSHWCTQNVYQRYGSLSLLPRITAKTYISLIRIQTSREYQRVKLQKGEGSSWETTNIWLMNSSTNAWRLHWNTTSAKIALTLPGYGFESKINNVAQSEVWPWFMIIGPKNTPRLAMPVQTRCPPNQSDCQVCSWRSSRRWMGGFPRRGFPRRIYIG